MGVGITDVAPCKARRSYRYTAGASSDNRKNGDKVRALRVSVTISAPPRFASIAAPAAREGKTVEGAIWTPVARRRAACAPL